VALLAVYDGAYGIGGNKLYMEEKGSGVFLDFGKNFGKYGVFYEEFLKNRYTHGIHHLVYLDLLPKLNIYRPDLIPVDLSLSQYPALNVAAVLLSHAHMDHCGNIGMLREGMQDTGVSSLEMDPAYFSPRQPTDDLGLYLSSIAGACYQGRDF
jgi:ribonuclease J